MIDERKKAAISLGVISILIILCMIFGIVYNTLVSQNNGMIPQIEENRFEIEHIEELPLINDETSYICVISDRNTDVQYLVVYDRNSMGITTMRDKGGTVLLRE